MSDIARPAEKLLIETCDGSAYLRQARVREAALRGRHGRAAGRSFGRGSETLATKADLRELELRLTNTLTMRMGAMCAGSTALTVAILGVLITLS